MKKTTILTLVPTAAIAAMVFSSCASTDPEYKAWKAKQQADAAANPYGAPTAGNNPYGVPQAGGEAGSYTPTTQSTGGTAPYQPIPGVAQSTTPATQYSPTTASIPSASGGSHTVVADDTLWGLARQYGTSVEAIQSANGLTSTVIRKGQSLVIPGN